MKRKVFSITCGLLLAATVVFYSSPVHAQMTWVQDSTLTGSPGCAKSIGVGPNNVPWVLGCNGSGPDYPVYYLQHTYAGYQWTYLPGVSGKRISVDLNGEPYVVTSSGQVWSATSGLSNGVLAPVGWLERSPSPLGAGGCLTQFAANQLRGGPSAQWEMFMTGAGFAVPGLWYGIGCGSSSNLGIYILDPEYAGSLWQRLDSAALASGLALFTNGSTQTPWVINTAGGVYFDLNNKFVATVQPPDPATYITDHFVITTRGHVFQWSDASSSWSSYIGNTTLAGDLITQIAYSSAISTSSIGTIGPSTLWSIGQSGNIYFAEPPLIFSPYKDTTISTNFNTGALQSKVTGTLEPVTSAMPNQTMTLAYGTGTCGSETWGGNTISVAQMKTDLQSFVNTGKNYILSVGGPVGSFDCPSGAAFLSFIKTYDSSNMLGVDFDFESSPSKAIIDDLITGAMAAQAQYPNMRFSFTIPAAGDPNGLPPNGLPVNANGALVLNELKTLGIGGNYTVNLLVFDFGSQDCTLENGQCEMGLSAIQAAELVHAKFGIPYNHIELTPMVGADDNGEVFTLADADTMSGWIRANGLAGAHFWAFDRDTNTSNGNTCSANLDSSTCNGYPAAGPLAFTNRFTFDLGTK